MLLSILSPYAIGQQSFRDGVILVLGTGYSMGCTLAIILNLVVPDEVDEGTPLPTSTASAVGAVAVIAGK